MSNRRYGVRRAWGAVAAAAVGASVGAASAGASQPSGPAVGGVAPAGATPGAPGTARMVEDLSTWVEIEYPLLADAIPLTSRRAFVKAGENYFNADASWVIFQAVPTPAQGQPPDAFYSMYVAPVRRAQNGSIAGLGTPVRLSPPGSANTCGWFHPDEPSRVLFSSTLVEPSLRDVPGYQRTTGRYVWQFHRETEIVTTDVREIAADSVRRSGATPADEGAGAAGQPAPARELTPLFERDGYCAEASWSKDGRFVLYAAFDLARSEKIGRNHLDIKVFDTVTGTHHALVTQDGYNGGPFFSPCGQMVCYRSDRDGSGRLQVFVATLRFEAGDDGVPVPVGVEREFQITANEHVNWAPFWHPSGNFLVYASSEVGHTNYEVFAVKVDRAALEAGQTPAEIPRRRVTYATGADVLPAFSADGEWFLWTAQRGEPGRGETRPSSQLWVARWRGGDDPFAVPAREVPMMRAPENEAPSGGRPASGSGATSGAGAR